MNRKMMEKRHGELKSLKKAEASRKNLTGERNRV